MADETKKTTYNESGHKLNLEVPEHTYASMENPSHTHEIEISQHQNALPNTEKKETDPEIKPEDVKKYSDKDVDEMFNKKFAKKMATWEKEKQAELDEARKLEKMNADEKAEYETQKLKKELEELRAEKNRNEMLKVARGMLADENINISDALLSMFVSDDAESTKANVTGFVELFNGEVAKALTEKLKTPTPRKMGTSTLTKDEILKIKDPTLRQKTIAENLELFKN